MLTVMLMVPTWPESGFLGRAARLRPTSRGGRGGERGLLGREGKQKVEMTVGDFGASGVGQRAVGRRGSTSASQDGGIMGSGFRSALSRGSVG